MDFGRKLERDFKRASLQNERYKKQRAQLIKNNTQANDLFQETLKVKQQYEELFVNLSQNQDVAPILQKYLAEMYLNKGNNSNSKTGSG